MATVTPAPTGDAAAMTTTTAGKQNVKIVVQKPTANNPQAAQAGGKDAIGENSPVPEKKKTHSRLEAKDTSKSKIRSACAANLLEQPWFITVTTVLTVYALFGDDVRLWATEKSADVAFYILSLLALIVFVVELFVTILGQPYYFDLSIWPRFALPSFYFWLDLAATGSMVPDVMPLFVTENTTQESSSDALKAGKASRAGTRAGRIIRLVRIVRMVRLVKAVRGKDSGEKKVQEQEDKPSAVGTKLSEVTIRKLIIIVLCCILILPILDGSLDGAQNLHHIYGLAELHRLPQDRNTSGSMTPRVFAERVRQYGRDVGKVLHVSIAPNCPPTVCKVSWSTSTINKWLKETTFQEANSPFSPYDQVKSPLTLSGEFWEPSKDIIDAEDEIYKLWRVAEVSQITLSGCYDEFGVMTEKTEDEVKASPCVSKAYLQIQTASQAGALLSIFKTFFMMFVLVGFSLLLTHDANILVVGPLERMMSMVKKLAKNPLGALSDEDDTKSKSLARTTDNDTEEEEYETVMLEKSLRKIGGLLQVGFGAAGADIIAKNMGRGELRMMEPGRKITSIFGFGIIEDFTDTVSCLEQEITQYINSIANIVHSSCNSYFGAPNKNIGSAFLMAWKICDGSLPGLVDPRDPPDDPEGKAAANRKIELKKRENMMGSWPNLAGVGKFARPVPPMELVDSALAAILRMRMGVARANNDGTFASFVVHPKMLKKFGPFKVRMGFGLHIGWAIEGAIGSKYKIDASYLSPNVNLSARLEAATHQFHTPMLMSHWFVEEMSEEAQRLCRLIDRVTVKGSEIPMGVYTFDITQTPRDITTYAPRFDSMGVQEPVDFGEHKWTSLRAGVKDVFFVDFKSAVDAYIAGNWDAAKTFLEKCQSVNEKDGPTKSLMAVMGRSNFAAPSDWKGYRGLTSK